MVFSMFSYKKEFVHKTFTHLTIKNEKLKSPLALKLYKKNHSFLKSIRRAPNYLIQLKMKGDVLRFYVEQLVVGIFSVSQSVQISGPHSIQNLSYLIFLVRIFNYLVWKLDSSLLSLSAVFGDVDVLWIVNSGKFFPFSWFVFNQVTEDLVGSGTLSFAALGAFSLKGIRKNTFQFTSFGTALALVQQAVIVVLEETVRFQDFINIEVIVFGGVFFVGKANGNKSQQNGNGEFHVELKRKSKEVR